MRHFVYLFVLILALFPTASKPVAAVDNIMSGRNKKTAPLSTLPQWQRIIEDYAFQRQLPLSGKTKALHKFIKSIENDTKLRQILKVNLWFNGYPYKQDNWIYNKADYWATPSEFLENGGDCEDFAIIKYLTLRQLGFTAKQMRIAMVYNVFSGTDHSLLLVEHDGEQYVLDNRENLTTPAHYTDRYKPHYVFNEKILWTYDSPLISNKVRKDSTSSILPGNR